jgi:hypothetical protein
VCPGEGDNTLASVHLYAAFYVLAMETAAKDIFEVPARRLGKTRVLKTLVDGGPVYQDASASASGP